MPYPIRTAVIHPSEPTLSVSLIFGGPVSVDSIWSISSNISFYNQGWGDPEEALLLFRRFTVGPSWSFVGLQDADFGRWNLGPAGDPSGFVALGLAMTVASGTAFNVLSASQLSANSITFDTEAYQYASFAGGEHSDSMPAAISYELVFAESISTPGGVCNGHPAPDSTPESPAALIFSNFHDPDWPGNPGADTYYFCAYRLTPDGTVTMEGTCGYGADGIGQDWFLRQGSEFHSFGYGFDLITFEEYWIVSRFTIGLFAHAFASTTWDFENFKAQIDDAWINSNYLDPVAAGYNLRLRATYHGWLLEYLDAASVKRAILISPDWATYQNVEFVGGDTETQAMLAAWAASATDGDLGGPHFATDAAGLWYMAYGPSASAQFAYEGEAATCLIDLGDIVRHVSMMAGIDLAEVDASALTQCVAGYSATQGPAKDWLAPLLDVYDADCRPHDFGIEFLRRGSVPARTISSEYFVREKAEDAAYVLKINNDTDLPRRVFLNFADLEAEQQPNAAVSQRTLDAVDSRRELSIDVTTLALAPDDAKPMADRFLRRIWFCRESAEFSLTAIESELENGDVVTLDLDGDQFIMKATKMVFRANGAIDTEWELDDPALAGLNSAPGAVQLGRPVPVIFAPGLTQGFMLDIPLLADAHDQTAPFIYLTAGPANQTDAWAGADILHSDSGEAGDFEAGWDAVASSEGCSWGTCSEALPAPASPYVIDTGPGIEVVMGFGDLASISEEAMLEDRTANLAAIRSGEGWEIVQFQSAVLTGVATYQVSGFIHGVQGTEQFMDGHAVGDSFVLLDQAKRHSLGIGEVGLTDYYLPISAGRDESSGTEIAVEFEAAAHRPLSPVQLELEYDAGSGSWFIRWTRRSRIGGATLNGSDVPLGESAEVYRTRIDGGSGDPERIIETTEAEAEWTQAMQVEDFGVPQAAISGSVCQRSPSLGLDGFESFFSAAA